MVPKKVESISRDLDARVVRCDCRRVLRLAAPAVPPGYDEEDAEHSPARPHGRVQTKGPQSGAEQPSHDSNRGQASRHAIDCPGERIKLRGQLRSERVFSLKVDAHTC